MPGGGPVAQCDMTVSAPARGTPERRVARLSSVSAKRVIEPDDEVLGDFGPGQILADDLLFPVAAGIALTAEQKVVLSREQTAAMLDGGIRLEGALLAGFGLMLTTWPDLTDPRVTYLLHEIGEETRHSRLFARMIAQLAPKAVNPFDSGPRSAVKAALYRAITHRPVLLLTMVLVGEEIPDLIQRRAIEHPDTDDYLRRANAYHREEEARHIAFAGILLPELWRRSPRRHRWLVKHAAPVFTQMMLDGQMLHPGIYAAAGLPLHRTQFRVKRSESYRAFLAEGMRPVLKALLAAAPELQDRVPRGWRRICRVDRRGVPLEPA